MNEFVAFQALKILQDEMQCDVIKVAGLVRNKVRGAHGNLTLLSCCLLCHHNYLASTWSLAWLGSGPSPSFAPLQLHTCLLCNLCA